MQIVEEPWENLEDSLNEVAPDIVGVTCVTLTYTNALRVASLVKAINFSIPVVIGGPHVTFTAEETLRNNPQVDVVVRGEGEYAMLELAKKLPSKVKLDSVLGITFRRNGGIIANPPRPLIRDLNALPLPARHLLPMEKYACPGSLITSRGCPQQCLFCSAGAMSGKRYRLRSPEGVVNEIELLLERYGDSIIYFPINDDTFTCAPRRAEEICQLLGERNLKIKFTFEGQAHTITKDLLEKLREAGCIGFCTGVESGSQRILDLIGKRVTLEQIRQAVRYGNKLGMEMVICSFIIGLPFDTEESVKKTIEFAEELWQLGATSTPFQALIPYPGTNVYEQREKYGLVIHETDWGKYTGLRPIISTKNLTRERIEELLALARMKAACHYS
jgi:radical SAM superfamily enzyme YgiQ (UPF0313 family)